MYELILTNGLRSLRFGRLFHMATIADRLNKDVIILDMNTNKVAAIRQDGTWTFMENDGTTSQVRARIE